ncbi:hypothetical protein ACTFIV_004075 [Dictyostelium citrinum]
MITDRCSTIALMVVLSHFYKDYENHFIALITLDIVSHFARLCATLQSGSKSHKAVKENHIKIMKIYYGNKYFLAFMCFGNEGFFLFSYLYHFYASATVFYILWGFFFPICAAKQIINAIQFFQAVDDIVSLDDQQKLKK